MNRHDFRLDEKLGLDRLESASYIGVSATIFDQMVADGRMPMPKEINARVVWDREALGLAFKALPDRLAAETAPKANPWERGRTQAGQAA